MILNILSFSNPFILCSVGALFSEYTGCLALFLDGLISFSAFLNYFFTVSTHSAILGFVFSSIISTLIVLGFSFFIERFNANKFIAGIAMNLLFSALPSCFSSIIFKTRGVLTSPFFSFELLSFRIFSIVFTVVIVVLALIFTNKTQAGLYLRITASDSAVLFSNGINPRITCMMGWGFAALFSSFAGNLLSMKISSFVPNISSGRGWMALAAVFLGKKKPLRIIASILIFCFADYLSANIQNYLPMIPTSLVLSLPYLVVLCLVFSNRI